MLPSFASKYTIYLYFTAYRKVALETYHRYECTVVDFLIASGMSIICFLAYRCITQKPLKFFLDNKETFKQHDKTSGSNKSQVNFLRWSKMCLIEKRVIQNLWISSWNLQMFSGHKISVRWLCQSLQLVYSPRSKKDERHFSSCHVCCDDAQMPKKVGIFRRRRQGKS